MPATPTMVGAEAPPGMGGLDDILPARKVTARVYTYSDDGRVQTYGQGRKPRNGWGLPKGQQEHFTGASSSADTRSHCEKAFSEEIADTIATVPTEATYRPVFEHPLIARANGSHQGALHPISPTRVDAIDNWIKNEVSHPSQRHSSAVGLKDTENKPPSPDRSTVHVEYQEGSSGCTSLPIQRASGVSNSEGTREAGHLAPHHGYTGGSSSAGQPETDDPVISDLDRKRMYAAAKLAEAAVSADPTLATRNGHHQCLQRKNSRHEYGDFGGPLEAVLQKQNPKGKNIAPKRDSNIADSRPLRTRTARMVEEAMNQWGGGLGDVLSTPSTGGPTDDKGEVQQVRNRTARVVEEAMIEWGGGLGDVLAASRARSTTRENSLAHHDSAEERAGVSTRHRAQHLHDQILSDFGGGLGDVLQPSASSRAASGQPADARAYEPIRRTNTSSRSQLAHEESHRGSNFFQERNRQPSEPQGARSQEIGAGNAPNLPRPRVQRAHRRDRMGHGDWSWEAERVNARGQEEQRLPFWEKERKAPVKPARHWRLVTANDDSSCTICLEEFKKGERAAKLRCSHLFHKACVQGWLLRATTCPNCREPVVPQS